MNCSLSAAASASPTVAATSGTRSHLRDPQEDSDRAQRHVAQDDPSGGWRQLTRNLTPSAPGFRRPRHRSHWRHSTSRRSRSWRSRSWPPRSCSRRCRRTRSWRSRNPAPALGLPRVPAPSVAAPGLGVPVAARPGLRLCLERGHLGSVERRTHDVPLAIQHHPVHRDVVLAAGELQRADSHRGAQAA